jgi:CRP-like cAMP-binding protein
MPADIANPLANRLLASLPSQDFERLKPSLKTISLAQGQLLSEPGDEVDQVHFPHNGMVSLLVVLKDGKAVECATIGREGVIGATAGLGLHRSIARAVIQLPMVASRISATAFRNAVKDSKPLRDLITRHQETMLMQAQVTAGCNALHAVEARLARWILQSRDRADSDTVALTQEFLAEMLAVRRTSVSEVAQQLQSAKLIRYSRGVIEVLNRKGLEQKACECYRTVVDYTAAAMSS